MTGYVDLQLNGYAGVDFNTDDLPLDSLRGACERLRKDGVAGALATIITADLDLMAARLNRIVKLREQDPLIRDVLFGIHIEGPFISSTAGYVGAHPPQHVQPATVAVMQKLLDAAGGLTRLVTLAPEHDAGLKTTQFLSKHGVAVSAGHCDPSLDALRAAIDAGLTMYTHLGNGCPIAIPRHDNIIQRVLSLSDRLWVMFIADGAHIPFFALTNYLKIVGTERAIVVTDAISAAGMGPGRYTIGGVEAIVGEDLVPHPPHNPQLLAGSSLTMAKAAENLATHLKMSAEQIERLLIRNPRQAVGW